MSEKRYKFTPTEIRTFFYCPRLYFFKTNLVEPIPLRKQFRLYIGKIYHQIKSIIGKLKGWQTEKTMTLEIGRYIIQGRTDAVEYREDIAHIHEYKSGKGPDKGVWLSDLMQAITYAFIHIRKNGNKAVISLHYRNKTETLEIESDTIAILMKALEDMRIIKQYGILPDPNPTKKKCEKCPFKDICEKLEADGALSSWVKDLGAVYKVRYA